MTYSQLMEDDSFCPSVVIDASGMSRSYPTPRYMERFYRFLKKRGHLNSKPRIATTVLPEDHALIDERPQFPITQ